MKNLDLIAEELFNKIRGRFPSVTIGDAEGKVTNKPTEARFYDFDYTEGDSKLGKVSISLADDAVEVMYSNDFVANEDVITRENWYNFLKELRQFSKKRMLKFDTRNINKSNLDQRDYKFLATNRTGDGTMNESKMYGTSKTSYQNVGEARIAIKHSKPVNTESATGRIQNISSIFIESPEGERFKYPFKHLNGARAMARHVAEGGKPYDDFGKHITGLSEELNSLKKFKSYVNRSSVMAEGLSGYMLPVNERLDDIKKTISSLQKESTYRTAFENFEQPVFEDVPEDVAENWIDQLTIKQFNEELKDVFPFVYRLVSEATKAKIVSASDLLGEQEVPFDIDGASAGPDPIHYVRRGDTVYSLAKAYGVNVDDVIEVNGLDDQGTIRPGDALIIPGSDIQNIGSNPQSGGTRGIDPKDNYSPDDFRRLTTGEALEDAFEEMMGQFGESDDEETDEGNKFTAALAKAKANDDDEMEVDGKKIPVTEFILSMYDRETGQFPKGETAVLTAVEKDYGEQFINPAKQFIEAINAKFEEINGYRDPDIQENDADQMSLDLPAGSGKPPRETDKEDRYRTQQIQKKFASDKEKAAAFEPGQRVRVDVRGLSPFMKKDRLGDWHPTKIYPQSGFITGTVVKLGTLGDVLVKLDNPAKYRETIRGKRVTTTLDQTEFRHWRLKPLDGEKASQDLNKVDFDDREHRLEQFLKRTSDGNGNVWSLAGKKFFYAPGDREAAIKRALMITDQGYDYTQIDHMLIGPINVDKYTNNEELDRISSLAGLK